MNNMTTTRSNQRNYNNMKRRSSNQNNSQRDAEIIKRGAERMVGTVVLPLSPFDFRPIGTSYAYPFKRRTTLIQSYTASSGSFVTNNSNCVLTQNASVSPTDVLLALAFRLDDLPDYQEFTNLFDQYCIIGVKVRITPRFVPSTGGTQAPNTGADVLYVAKDSSDITLPASVSVLREYQTVKEFTPLTLTNRRLEMKHSPRVAVAAYTGSFSGYTAPSLVWVDSQSANVQHYGMKMGIPAGMSGGTSNVFDMEFTYNIVCRMGQ